MSIYSVLICSVLSLIVLAGAEVAKSRRAVEVEGSLPHVLNCPDLETVSDFHNMLTLPKRFAAHKISFRYGEFSISNC